MQDTKPDFVNIASILFSHGLPSLQSMVSILENMYKSGYMDSKKESIKKVEQIISERQLKGE